jgi:NitT/TauT family transport system ATP-binding protein
LPGTVWASAGYTFYNLEPKEVASLDITKDINSLAPQVIIENVDKVFSSGQREVIALKGITLTISNGEFVSILGPSGCGKSTLLNAIAGFSLPTSGRLVANGVEVTLPGPDRGMVFQEYALFPWMTVADNIAFGLKVKKLPKQEIREKVDTLLAKLQLLDFRDRFPKDLSGGMKQRVAIARVLALDPPMMLMDEPFGALDALTRRNLQDELLRIWMEFRKTVIFVTHSIEESIYLADRVVVMTYRPGTIKQIVGVELSRPRDVSSLQFIRLQKELTSLVMEEQMRYRNEEMEEIRESAEE